MKSYSLAIRDLPRLERPREKLIKYGPDHLSDHELLAILLRTGRRGEGVLSLAQKLLKTIPLDRFSILSSQDLRSTCGVGIAKACELLACIELGKRLFLNKKITISQLLTPQDVFESLKDIRESKKEHFLALFLDSRNQQIHKEIISVGTINASLVHPREVFEPAVRYLSVQIILAHNHPSGDLEPSGEDLEVSKRLVMAGKIMGIEIVDHVIVSKSSFVSFREKGLL